MWKNLSAMAVCVSLLGISSVAHAEHRMHKWARPATNYDQYLKDRSTCLAEGADQAPIMPVYSTRGIIQATHAISAQAVADCMVARGYVEDEVKGFAPPNGGDAVVGGIVTLYASKISAD